MWYVIDAVDRVADLSMDWDASAARGGAPELTRDSVLGRSIWSFIDGDATRFHYAHVFEAARQTGKPSDFKLRADAPGRESLLGLKVRPRPDQSICITVETIRERVVRKRPLWDMQLPRSGERVRVCTWCKSISVGSTWVQVDLAEQNWPELASNEPPGLDHHVCPSCETAMNQVRQAMMSYAEKAG